MTYGHVMPELEAHLKATPRPKRPHQTLPSQGKTAPPSRYPREQVIAAILAVLGGATTATVAAQSGVPVDTVQHWVDGTNRADCRREAERRWRQQLKGRHAVHT